MSHLPPGSILSLGNIDILEPFSSCSLYLVFEHCMDSSLRSSLPHLTRWFTTVLGQKEVKEVLAGLNLKESVPKAGAVTAATTVEAPKPKSSPGKGLFVSPLKEGNWHQNSQTSFVCSKPFLVAFPQPSSWHQNSQVCFVCLELLFFTPCSHQPLLAFTVSFSSCFSLDDPCTSLPLARSRALLVYEVHCFPKLQRQALLPVEKPWKRLLLKV